MGAMNRVVIVASRESYRTGDFLAAAALLRAEAVVASDAPPPLAEAGQIAVDLDDPPAAAATIANLVPQPDAVIAIDDQGAAVAAEASRLLGLAHNPRSAVAATRDKRLMRRLLAEAGVDQPSFRMAQPGAVPKMAAELGYPVVVKPTGLSASRGVIKANGSAAASRAERRIRDILIAAGRSRDEALLVEEYVPGSEVAVEGLLVDGRLEVMAFIDKPDPLEGPFFEETLLITPSRLPPETQDAVVGLVDAARKALGLRTGPIHAEVRIPPDGSPRLIELAARPIGGLCGRAFTFGLLNESLEVMLLRSALGLSTIDTTPARPASGVLMLPIPATGILNGVGGLDEAKAMVGVDDVSITIAYGRRVTALPEADRYLGFVFASGRSPKAVEDTLREASSVLSVTIDGEAMQPAVTAPDRP